MCHCCTFWPMTIMMPVRIRNLFGSHDFLCLVIPCIFLCGLKLQLPSTTQKYMSYFQVFFCYWFSTQNLLYLFFFPHLFFSSLHLFCFSFREVDGQWVEEEKLEAHSDWVRDVAWAPNVGLPVSTIASCSQVK